MKKIFLVLIVCACILTCTAQNYKNMLPTIDNKFETFDTKRFEAIPGERQNFMSEFLPNGNYLVMSENKTRKQYVEHFKDSYFKIVKIYYTNGNIKLKGIAFNSGGFRMGTWYEFDEQGNLIEEVDHDKLFKFKFEDILAFCKKQGIRVDKGPILQSTGYHTRIFRGMGDEGKAWWRIKWLRKMDLLEEITLDGTTGEIIKRKESHYINN